jgi:hypothetical protein
MVNNVPTVIKEIGMSTEFFRKYIDLLSEDNQQAMAADLSRYFHGLAKDFRASQGDDADENDQEYQEMISIAQAFKQGIKPGLEEVRMSTFEFSSNPFGDFGRGIDDGPAPELVQILDKYGYAPGPDGADDQATIVRKV